MFYSSPETAGTLFAFWPSVTGNVELCCSSPVSRNRTLKSARTVALTAANRKKIQKEQRRSLIVHNQNSGAANHEEGVLYL